ncbi:MAG: hypothetical protein K2M61_04950 [Muribaculaceae bacterium]|nr:hypothetical protein [Muribaculaceae bacterium]
MKKLYSFAAMVAMSVTAAFATAGTQLPQAVEGTLTPTAAPVAKALSAKRTAHALKGSPVNTKLVSPVNAHKTIAKDAASEPGWEYIGDASYNDGILYGAYRSTIKVDQAEYQVKTYVNTQYGNPEYRLEDIYPSWYLNLLPTPLYVPTNGKPSSVTLTFYDEESAMATFDLHLTCTTDNSRFDVRQITWGTFKDGVFHFDDSAYELLYNNVLSGYSLPFDIKVPDIPEPEEIAWKPIGEAMFSDGILCSMDPNSPASDPYAVQAYQHPTDKNVYKLDNIFPDEYLQQVYGYEATDGKPSSVILTYTDDGVAKADFDLNITCSMFGNMPVTVEPLTSGTYEDRKFHFDADAFDVCFEGLPYWRTLAFDIEVPEAPETTDPEPTEPTEPEWNEIGDAQYADGLLYAVYGVTEASDSYPVKAYQSASDQNVYKLDDIYPTDYLDIEGIYAQTDGKKSSVILSYNADGEAFAAFELYITDTTDNTQLTVEATGNGQYIDGVFHFPEDTFTIFYDGMALGYNLDFNIKLPGATDYSLDFTSFGGICNASKTFEFSLNAGSDAAGIKYGIFSGLWPATAENLDYVAKNGISTEAGNYTLSLDALESGWYSIIATTITPEGTAAFGEVKYFYAQPDFVESEWISLGSVSYTDALFGAGTWDVNLYENKANPGVLVVEDPYGVLGEDNHGHSHYIFIDATNPDEVYIALQPIGLNLGDVEDYSIQSDKPGTIKDGVLTFPENGLIVVNATMNGYYFNQNGEFALEVPNLLKATVTCDGKPLEGAFVNDANWEGEGVYTDAEGVAYLPAKAVQTEFIAYKDGYEMDTFTPEASGRALTASVALEAAEASFSVTVLDEEGETLAGAYVYFLDQELTTAENGNAKFTNLSAPALIGTTQPFAVYKDGYKYFEGEADFTETFDAFSVVTLQAEEASLTVIVLNSKDETVEGAQVLFNDQQYTTDDSGKVVISGISFPEVAGKTVPVTIIAEGYKDWIGEADFTETLDSYLVVTLLEDPTSIGSVLIDLDAADTKIYDLNGRRVSNPENGNVYIVNGLKVRINK